MLWVRQVVSLDVGGQSILDGGQAPGHGNYSRDALRQSLRKDCLECLRMNLDCHLEVLFKYPLKVSRVGRHYLAEQLVQGIEHKVNKSPLRVFTLDLAKLPRRLIIVNISPEEPYELFLIQQFLTVGNSFSVLSGTLLLELARKMVMSLLPSEVYGRKGVQIKDERIFS